MVERLLDRLGSQLLDSDDQLTSAIAETNATGWGVDEWEVLSAEYLRPDEISFAAGFGADGEQDEDKPFSGSYLRFRVDGRAQNVGGTWEITDADVSDVTSDF